MVKAAIYRLTHWSIIKLVSFFLSGLLLAGFTWILLSQAAEPEVPYSADKFVDSVGLNVRMSYSDWPTSTNWKNPNPKQNSRQLIADLGIRHLRDRIPHPDLQSTISYVNPRLATLSLDHGMTFIAGVDFRKDDVLDGSKTSAMVDWYANGEITSEQGKTINVRDMVEAIEGPNEYDRHHKPDEREDNWAANLESYQDTIYNAVRAVGALSSRPVIAPSLIHTEYCQSALGSFADSADLGNLHPYPNYPYMRHPTATLDWHLERVDGCTQEKPIWATETGYFTKKDAPSEISEETAAKYTSRLLAEYFLTQEIERTFLHEIVRDTVDGWGLVAAEPGENSINGQSQFQLRPKPAYTAVKSLLSLLKESSWNAEERLWRSPEVTLRPVNIAFEGKQSSTHHLLLQKSDDHYYLLLWQEVESYNPDDENFDVAPDELTVKLPFNARPAAVYQYDDMFAYAEAPLEQTVRAVQLSVPDSVMVLEFAM
ncbi:MAG: hypothetical protein WBA10_14070 [Elainellaceae cyanobacterium]